MSRHRNDEIFQFEKVGVTDRYNGNFQEEMVDGQQ
jgi:hypothetical protein